MSTIIIEEVYKCVRYIIKKFDYEKRDLDEGSLKRLKNFIKSNDEFIPEFEKYLLTNLKSNDSDKRLCIVQIVDYFFQRSHHFRSVFLEDLQEFLTYTLELDPLYYPLPDPPKAATLLKKESLRIFKLWDEKFSSGYPKLGRTKTMLMKSKNFNFDRIDGLTATERSRLDVERTRQEIVNKKVQDEVYKEYNESKVHIEEAIVGTKTILTLLFPDFRQEDDNPSTSLTIGEISESKSLLDLPERVIVTLPNGVAIEKSDDNNELLKQLTDSKKLLGSNLSKVTEWIKRLTKHGSTAEIMNNLLKLQKGLKDELTRCNDIKIVEKRKAVLANTVEINQSDSEEDDEFETVDLAIKDPENLGKDIEFKLDEPKSPKIEQQPKSVEDKQKSNNPLVKRSMMIDDAEIPGPSKKPTAPVLPYGLDLKYWGKNVTPAEIPKNRFDGHRFWRPADEEVVNRECEDVYKTRVITYIGEMTKVKRSCRHPLPSGKLCPRMDRKTCPIHGPVIDRDEQGDPDDMSAASQYKRAQDEFVKKKNEADEDAYLKELEIQTGGKFSYDLAKKAKDKKRRKNEGKKREKTAGEALRERLQKKLFDKRTLRRIGKTLDSIQVARTREKFAHQFNY